MPQLQRAEKEFLDAFGCNKDGLLLQTKKQKYNLFHFHLRFLRDINHSETDSHTNRKELVRNFPEQIQNAAAKYGSP